MQSCRARGAFDVQSSSAEMEIQLGRARKMRGGNRIANVPRKDVKNQTASTLSAGQEGSQGKDGASQSAERRGESSTSRRKYRENPGPQGLPGYCSYRPAAWSTGLHLGRSQASDTKHSLVVDQLSSSSPGRHSPSGQETSKSSSSSRI